MRYGIIAALLVGLGGTASAQYGADNGQYGGGRWEFVASKTVGPNTDTDTAGVNSNRTFGQLRVCVSRAPINMQSFVVSYRNGSQEDVQLRNRFKAGSCSRAIDLRGKGERHITQITMRYERVKRGSRTPLVTVSGR